MIIQPFWGYPYLRIFWGIELTWINNMVHFSPYMLLHSRLSLLCCIKHMRWWAQVANTNLVLWFQFCFISIPVYGVDDCDDHDDDNDDDDDDCDDDPTLHSLISQGCWTTSQEVNQGTIPAEEQQSLLPKLCARLGCSKLVRHDNWLQCGATGVHDFTANNKMVEQP